jgi:hypothetical protein
MEQILRDENYADVPMMTAVGEGVAHVPQIGLVQPVVQHHESRPVTHLLEIRDALMKGDLSSRLGQLLARDFGVFVETPDDITKV